MHPLRYFSQIEPPVSLLKISLCALRVNIPLRPLRETSRHMREKSYKEQQQQKKDHQEYGSYFNAGAGFREFITTNRTHFFRSVDFHGTGGAFFLLHLIALKNLIQ